MVDDWDQIRTLLKQIQPEDRGAIRFWLREGLAFGEELSHDVRQVISKHSPEAARMTERVRRSSSNVRSVPLPFFDKMVVDAHDGKVDGSSRT
jgi:hypothetical protein